MSSRPARGLVLVRPVQTEDTLPGGKIVIPDKAREKFAAYQVRVVAVGEPEICEDEDCQRPHGLLAGYRTNGEWFEENYHNTPQSLQDGAWAIVAPRSYIPAAPDGQPLYFVRQSDILGVFRLDS